MSTKLPHKWHLVSISGLAYFPSYPVQHSEGEPEALRPGGAFKNDPRSVASKIPTKFCKSVFGQLWWGELLDIELKLMTSALLYCSKKSSIGDGGQGWGWEQKIIILAPPPSRQSLDYWRTDTKLSESSLLQGPCLLVFETFLWDRDPKLCWSIPKEALTFLLLKICC